jgi:hypothetical protein
MRIRGSSSTIRTAGGFGGILVKTVNLGCGVGD